MSTTTKTPRFATSARAPRVPMDIVVENMRVIRLQNGLSQEAVGDRMGGLSQAYISDIERGNKGLSYESVVKLAAALGTTIDDLITDAAAA